MKKALITVGLPACGKSTLYNQYFTDYIQLERDILRKEQFEKDHPNEKFSFSKWTSELEESHKLYYRNKIDEIIKTNQDICFTDTHLNDRTRFVLINKLKENNYTVLVVAFTTTEEVCKERNSKRQHPIPDHVYDNMRENYQETCLGHKLVLESEELGYELTFISN